MRTNPQFPMDLVTFTEEILNGELHFLCSEMGLITCIGISHIKIFEIMKFDDEERKARCNFSVKANSLAWTGQSTD